MNTGRLLRMIVIGGSSGGLQAVLKLLQGIDPAFRIPIVVVLHQLKHPSGRLTAILQARTRLQVKEPVDKEPVEPSTIYVAPPDYHLLVETELRFSYSYSEAVNYSRPSIDVLFETAAIACADQLAGILLTGANNDGAAGLMKIGQAGGMTIVQDPAEAEIPVMPHSAIALRKPDHILKITEIHQLLKQLTYANVESV